MMRLSLALAATLAMMTHVYAQAAYRDDQLTLPKQTDAPKGRSAGDVRFNTSTGKLEWWDGNGNWFSSDSAPFYSSGGSANRSEASRWSDFINPRDYGAIGDGNSHTVSATLGVTTLAGLASYKLNGVTPFSFINQYPYGNLFDLQISTAATIGATTLSFGKTQNEGLTYIANATSSGQTTISGTASPDITTGSTIPASASIAASTTVTGNFGGSITINNATVGSIAQGAPIPIYQPSPSTPAVILTTTASGAAIPINVAPGLDNRLAGCIVTGTNIPANDTIVSISGGMLMLANVISGSVAAAATLAIQCSYVVYLQDATGVYQGMSVSGTNIPAGTQVDWVNPSTLRAGLSQPTTALVPGNTTLTFVQSWISHVTAGMQLTSPALSSATTVTSVNTTTGAVGIASGLTSAASPATSNYTATPAYEGTDFAFYSPYTDAQAASLQMDGLATNAAVQQAKTNGWTIRPPAGKYLIDEDIIIPLKVSDTTPSISVIGDGIGATIFVPHADLGPSQYVFSCGDPTATAANGRGLWTNGGEYCPGDFRDFGIVAATTFNVGVRPQLNGVPIAMGGVRQGPRRNMREVNISGLNAGVQFQGDWTTWDRVSSSGNFAGLRLDDPITNLFGDLNFTQDFFGGNAFAGISISPKAALIGTHGVKSWVADQPYNIWLEPGLPVSEVSIEQTDISNFNFEGAGCSAIRDGNIFLSSTAANSAHSIQDTVIKSSFFSSAAYGFTLPGGCKWTAYIDIKGAYGFSIQDIPANSFIWQFGGISAVRLATTETAINRGGLTLSGAGLASVAASYGALCQELVTGAGGTASQFATSLSWQLVNLDFGNGNYGRILPIVDSGIPTGPGAGLLFEQVASGGSIISQRAGQASAGTAPLSGVLAVPYSGNSGCPITAKFMPVITRGLQIPVAVTASPTLGSLLQTDSANPGAAKAAASVTTGISAGQVVSTNGGSTSLVYTSGNLAP